MRKKTLQETKNVIKYNIKQHKPSCGENRTFSPRHTAVVSMRFDKKVRRSLWSENTRYLAYQEHKYITGEIL